MGMEIVNRGSSTYRLRGYIGWMCVGIDGGEMSKDEIVGVLSGVIMDGRVDVRSKLSAIGLWGCLRRVLVRMSV